MANSRGRFSLGAETSSTPVSDNAEAGAYHTKFEFAFVTMPANLHDIQITGIEWKNGATVSGSMNCGVYHVDADPPTVAIMQLIASAPAIACSGASVVQRQSTIHQIGKVRGGDVLAVYISPTLTAHTLRRQTGLTDQNQEKAIASTAAPPLSEGTAWSNITAHLYVKLYWKPII